MLPVAANGTLPNFKPKSFTRGTPGCQQPTEWFGTFASALAALAIRYAESASALGLQPSADSAKGAFGSIP
uniref:Uncharacterized protein n=1 Tax=mine drainage metagenome TaxID=410659 RepID=E6QB34_9ZZZZ